MPPNDSYQLFNLSLANNSINASNEDCELWEGDFVSNLIKIMTAAWALIAILGILSNACVLVVFLMGKKNLNVTQCFIINLALSDMLFLIICPTFLIISYNDLQITIFNNIPEILGAFYCKLDYFSTNVCVFITCLTLLVMTFDRFIVIMFPLRSLTFRSKKKVIMANIFIWIFSIVLSLPQGYYRSLETFDSFPTQVRICTNSIDLQNTTLNLLYMVEINMEQFFVLYTILVSYIIPLLVIVVCYVIMIKKLYKEKQELTETRQTQNKLKRKQNRRRILFMIFLVSALFCTCWFPIHSIIFSLKFFKDFPHCSKGLYAIKAISHTLIFLNSMLNPFVYTIIGNSFQKKATEQKLRLQSYYSRSSFGNESVRSDLGRTLIGRKFDGSYSYNPNFLNSPNCTLNLKRSNKLKMLTSFVDKKNNNVLTTTTF